MESCILQFYRWDLCLEDWQECWSIWPSYTWQTNPLAGAALEAVSKYASGAQYSMLCITCCPHGVTLGSPPPFPVSIYLFINSVSWHGVARSGSGPPPPIFPASLGHYCRACRKVFSLWRTQPFLMQGIPAGCQQQHSEYSYPCWGMMPGPHAAFGTCLKISCGLGGCFSATACPLCTHLLPDGQTGYSLCTIAPWLFWLLDTAYPRKPGSLWEGSRMSCPGCVHSM